MILARGLSGILLGMAILNSPNHTMCTGWLIRTLIVPFIRGSIIWLSSKMWMMLQTIRSNGGFTGQKLAKIPILCTMMFISWLVQISICLRRSGRDLWRKAIAKNQMIINMMIGLEIDGSSIQKVRSLSRLHMTPSGTRRKTFGTAFTSQSNQLNL